MKTCCHRASSSPRDNAPRHSGITHLGLSPKGATGSNHDTPLSVEADPRQKRGGGRWSPPRPSIAASVNAQLWWLMLGSNGSNAVDELRALNPGQPMLTALEAKIRQMRTVREMLVPAS